MALSVNKFLGWAVGEVAAEEEEAAASVASVALAAAVGSVGAMGGLANPPTPPEPSTPSWGVVNKDVGAEDVNVGADMIVNFGGMWVMPCQDTV